MNNFTYDRALAIWQSIVNKRGITNISILSKDCDTTNNNTLNKEAISVHAIEDQDMHNSFFSPNSCKNKILIKSIKKHDVTEVQV